MLGRNIRAIEAEVPQRRSAASWLGVEEHCQQRRQGRRCHSYGLHAGCRDGRATNGDAAARRCLLGLLLDQAAAAESMHSGRSRGGRRRRRPAGPAAGSRRARPPARRAGRHGTSCWAGDAGWVNRVAVAGIHVVATRYETWLRPRASHACHASEAQKSISPRSCGLDQQSYNAVVDYVPCTGLAAAIAAMMRAASELRAASTRG